MAVAEKYEVLHPMKYRGVSYEVGEAIARDTILADKQVGVAKLGTLQRVGYIRLDPATRPIKSMKVAELLDYGLEIGADVTRGMTKPVMLEEIERTLA